MQSQEVPQPEIGPVVAAVLNSRHMFSFAFHPRQNSPPRGFAAAVCSLRYLRARNHSGRLWLGLIPSLFGSLIPAAAAPNDLTTVALAWDPSPDPRVSSYCIYYGVASRQYTNGMTVGNVTSATISNLVKGVTYYFTTTARDIIGGESAFSNEVQYSAGMPALVVNLHIDSACRPALNARTQAGLSYAVEATQNFTTWTTLATVTADTNGNVNYVDTATTSLNRRFYRLRQVMP